MDTNPNPDERPDPVAILGDIHGCAEELRALLAAIDDRALISLGDVVDRGPDPAGCIDALRARGARVLLGNHEEKHLRYRRHREAARRGRANPVQMAPHHLLTQQLVDDAAWDWLARASVPHLRLAAHGVLCVHAGLLAGVRAEDHAPERICRVQLTKPGSAKSPHGQLLAGADGRFASADAHGEGWVAQGYRFFSEYLAGPEVVVYGHSVFARPMRSLRGPAGVEHRACAGDEVAREGLVALGIDTGAPFGGALTALLLPEWRLVRVPAKARYWGGRLSD